MQSPLLRWLLRLPTAIYRVHGGWLLGRRFLLLIHTGRTSGLERWTVLEVLHYNDASREAVVMSGFGRRSNWLLNLQHTPPLQVIIGKEKFVPKWRELTVEEAVVILANYEWRNRFVAPIVRLVLSHLVGWRYDGTDEERRRLVVALPLISFSPIDN